MTETMTIPVLSSSKKRVLERRIPIVQPASMLLRTCQGPAYMETGWRRSSSCSVRSMYQRERSQNFWNPGKEMTTKN